ncbi:MAG: PilZ domain-containing protein [Pyrinomonadaceae bacterium]|nr:PilZ domain-containing protein [Pyrinomonadaceae bacterium]
MKNPNKRPKNDKRSAERSSTELRTIVQVKNSEDEVWKEITKVTTISRNGAGFALTRPCSVGRLISLVLPMPPELRAYDLKEKVYPIMGLVQYCNPVTVNGVPTYHVGVGFVGKEMPDSYSADPQQGYRITGVGNDGLWKFTEAGSAFKPRQSPRLWAAVDTSISLIKKDRLPSDKEAVVTNNISARGLSAFCQLTAQIGDRVKVACKDYNFYAIAIVRNCQPADNGNSIHLEFVEHNFPMEKLYAERAAALMKAREALQQTLEPDDEDESDDDARPVPAAAEYTPSGFELLRY